MNVSIIIILVILAVIIFWAIWVYNRIIALYAKYGQSFANIDVQLKRRFDLIPNLVETIKAYAKHERETLDSVIEARNKAMEIKVDLSDPSKIDKEQIAAFMEATGGLEGALKNLFALSENYPDLKADKNFLELQRQIEDTEDKIESARAAFNAAVATYNVFINMFPNLIIAKMFNFKEVDMFEIKDEKERERVEVNFD